MREEQEWENEIERGGEIGKRQKRVGHLCQNLACYQIKTYVLQLHLQQKYCICYFALWRCHSGLSTINWSVLTMKYIDYRQEVFYVSLTTQIATIPRGVVRPRIISGLLVEVLFIHFLPNFQTNSSTISTEVDFISVRLVTVLWQLSLHLMTIFTQIFSDNTLIFGTLNIQYLGFQMPG